MPPPRSVAALAGLFAGVMADRVSKKRLLVVAQTWSIIVYAAMAWIVLMPRNDGKGRS